MPVQLHENFIYGNRQVKEVWCILPCCAWCHLIEKRRDIKEKLNWMMLNRATEEELSRYSKILPLAKMRDELNKKYGKYISEEN